MGTDDGGPGTTTIVVMGVSGSGKSTVAAGLVERLGWGVAEGDDFPPPAHRENKGARPPPAGEGGEDARRPPPRRRGPLAVAAHPGGLDRRARAGRPLGRRHLLGP